MSSHATDAPIDADTVVCSGEDTVTEEAVEHEHDSDGDSIPDLVLLPESDNEDFYESCECLKRNFCRLILTATR